MARINLEKKPRDFGLPAPLSRCALVCSRSSALLRLCAQTFGCVSRLFPVCSSCLNGCPCVPSPTANTKTLTSCPQTNDRGYRAALWHFAAVFCGYFVGMQMQCRPAVSRVTELAPRPCCDPRGSELLPCARLFSPTVSTSYPP